MKKYYQNVKYEGTLLFPQFDPNALLRVFDLSLLKEKEMVNCINIM